MFELDVDNLNEMEGELDMEMPHRYSKDRKDVNGFFVFLPVLFNFLFITFYSVLNSNSQFIFFPIFSPFDLIRNYD